MQYILRTILLYLTCLLCNTIAYAEKNLPVSSSEHIAFIISNQQAIYEEVVNAAKSRLISAGNVINNQSIPTYDIDTWNNLSDEQIRKLKLIVGVGTNACDAILRIPQSDNQRICSFVPKSTFQYLVRKNHENLARSKNEAAAIYIDQPLMRLLSFVKKVVPTVETVGTIVSINNKTTINELQTLGKNFGVKLNTIVFDPVHTRRNDIKEVIRTSDLLLAIADPTVHTPSMAKWLLYNAYHDHKPIIAFSRSYTTAGALASIYSTPEQIGKQTGEIVLDWVKNGQIHSPQLRAPRFFTISVNRGIATSLRLEVPEELSIKKSMEQDMLGMRTRK